MNNCCQLSRVWEQKALRCKDGNNEESITLPPVGEIEPE